MRLSSGRSGRGLVASFAVLAACSPGADDASARPAQPRAALGYLTEAQALIGLDQVRSAGWTGAGITVAVIDSGSDTTHPDLAGRVIAEACFCGTNCCPDGSSEQLGPGSAMDDHGHGTHVASAIASQGAVAALGGAPDVSLVSVKVLDDNLGFCCMSDVVAALDWIALHHPEVQVVNVSLGASTLYEGDCDGLNTVLGQSIDALRASGTLVVAAAGNDGSSSSMRAPACIAGALSVGAVWDEDVGARSDYCNEPSTAADRIACFSNASSTTDLLAPGGVIEASWPGGGTLEQTGTSDAAPIVSACIAALLQAVPDATPDAIETALEQTGAPLLDARNGLSYPRIDCTAALDALLPDPTTDEDGGVADEDAGAAAIDGGAAGDAGAGLDAGTPPAPDAAATDAAAEAGVADAASPSDADADDSAIASAGAGADAGADAGERSGDPDGCSCRTSARGPAPDPAVLLALMVLTRRRRRGG